MYPSVRAGPGRGNGKKFGLTHGEAYHYIGSAPAKVEDYISKNAVKL
jgi:hypothetical protein